MCGGNKHSQLFGGERGGYNAPWGNFVLALIESQSDIQLLINDILVNCTTGVREYEDIQFLLVIGAAEAKYSGTWDSWLTLEDVQGELDLASQTSNLIKIGGSPIEEICNCQLDLCWN